MKNLILLLLAVFILDSCASNKPACGSKRQHKSRNAKMRKMAPSMSH